MTEYEQLGEYQQRLVSYVYQHSNRLSHEDCMAWLDKWTPAWRLQDDKPSSQELA